jgi:hypothetical protein
VLGHVALLLAYAVAALPLTHALAVVAPLVLLGTFYASTDGMLAAVAGHLVGPEVRASGIACAQTVVVLARFAASAGFGVLWFTQGPRTALLLVAGVLLTTIPVALVLLRGTERAGVRRTRAAAQGEP